jgi:DNA-binding LacI/PurR family transcriptional regulator
MPITLRELGKATGFSIVTFSRVLKGRSDLVSFETKQEILAMAKELGYWPILVGRNLRSPRANTIGLMVDNVL